MPPLTVQEEGLTKGTSCPSHCPMLGASWAAPACAWEGIVAANPVHVSQVGGCPHMCP